MNICPPSHTSAQTHLQNKMFYTVSQQEHFSVERQLKLGQRSKVKDWPAAPPEHKALNMDFTSCLLMYKIDNLHFVQKSLCPEPCLCHKQILAFLTLKRESNFLNYFVPLKHGSFATEELWDHTRVSASQKLSPLLLTGSDS